MLLRYFFAIATRGQGRGGMLLMHLLLSDFSLVLLLLESSSALCDLLCILLLLFYVSKEGYREKVGGDAINDS